MPTYPLTPARAGELLGIPATYGDPDLVDACGTILRAEAPIQKVDLPEYDPFYVISKHADILNIETHHHEWFNTEKAAILRRDSLAERHRRGIRTRTLVQMDGDEHRQHRGLLAPWFQNRTLGELEPRMRALAVAAVDHMAVIEDECDFATEVAMQYPLQMILTMMGMPPEDFPMMLRLTQEFFGAQDPQLSRTGDPKTAQAEVLADFFAYFDEITKIRRQQPTDDLSSIIANATLDGDLIGDTERLSHFFIATTAGHDTTAAAVAGGLLALIRHPEQLARVQADMSLLPTAVDEILRWTTPVKHFARVCQAPYELRGHQFVPGDRVMLAYPSANRDEDVFDEPFRFDVGRTPNRVLTFGFGVHFCLGSVMARMELRALFGELLPRLESIELAGAPTFAEATLVSGPKRLPIRCTIRPAV